MSGIRYVILVLVSSKELSTCNSVGLEIKKVVVTSQKIPASKFSGALTGAA